MSELPKDKQPTDDVLWDGTSEDLEEWISQVFNTKQNAGAEIMISSIEG